jgi:magnesium-transporting ATPase (P-type)
VLLEYQILLVFPFSSASKRMGIVVRDPAGQVVLYLKGADTELRKKVSVNQEGAIADYC